MDPTLASVKQTLDPINVACIVQVAIRRIFRTLRNSYDGALLRPRSFHIPSMTGS